MVRTSITGDSETGSADIILFRGCQASKYDDDSRIIIRAILECQARTGFVVSQRKREFSLPVEKSVSTSILGALHSFARDLSSIGFDVGSFSSRCVGTA